MSHTWGDDEVVRFAFETKAFVTELNAALSQLFRPLGITGVQAEALMALDGLGSASLKELSEHLVAESGHPSRLVSKLVAEGWVERTRSGVDGRAVELRLTERGRELASGARAARAPLIEVCRQLYGDRVAATTELLVEIRAALAQQQRAGHGSGSA